MSDKPEATRPFSATFASIGAVYETDDLTTVQCRPTGFSESTAVGCEKWSNGWGRQYHSRMCRALSGVSLRVMICRRQRILLQQRYRCLRVHTYTEKETAVVSHATIQDGYEISQLRREWRLPGLTRNPVYWHPSLEGATSDASGSSDAQNKRWGVSIMGYIAYGA